MDHVCHSFGRPPQRPSFDHGLLRHCTVALLALAVLTTGCTTLQVVEMPADALRAALRSGTVAPLGKKVVIVTADGAEHVVKFVAADAAADVVRATSAGGEPLALPIGDIVEMQTREKDGGRTALLVVGAVAVLVLAAVAFREGAEDVAEDFGRCLGLTLVGQECP